jgi:homoserine kinase
VTVRVPATSANLGPGFDCLGLALKQYTTFEIELLLGSVEQDHKPLIEIFSAWGDDPAIDALPVDSHNLFYQAFSQRLIALGMPVPSVRVRVTIGIPPGRGLGSSATAVVGGLLAADAAAGRVYSGERRVNLLDAAVELEHGKHADNIAASLLGGLVVVTRDERNGTWYAIPTFVPANLRAVLFVPNFPIDTVLGRTLLPTGYTKVDALHNVGHAALLLAARAAGAYGGCLSGSGPTILALAAEQAREVALALEQAARALKVDGRVVIAEIDHCGASVEVEHYRAISKIDTSQHGDIVLSCTGCERTAG